MKNESKYKYDAKRAIQCEDYLVLEIVSEAIDYTNAKPEDAIIEIDVEKYYEHCYRKYFKKLIERNVNILKLDRYQVEFDLRMKYLNAMNRISMYNVEKLRLLAMAKRFVQEYEDYLNK